MNKYINKYTPTKSNDFIGHFKFINDFKSHLKNEYDSKIILCIGNSGVGKTTLLNTIFNELNYTIKILNNTENYKDEINSYLNSKTIDTFFTNKKHIIFIDDLDIHIHNEKSFISYLCNIKNVNKIPIICVINKLYERKITDLKKISNIFYFNKPNINITTQYILNIFDKEDIEVDKIRLDNIKKIIKVYKNNIKLILLNLDNIILNKELKDYCYYENNFNDSGLFDIINKLFNKKYSIEQLDDIVYSDSNLICMLLHENILNELKIRRKLSNNEIIDIYSNILDDTCNGDFLEKFVYKNNEWKLLNLLYIVKIFNLNNKVNDYKIKEHNIKYNFTQILTKYGIKCNYNKKKIKMFEKNNISQTYFDNLNQNLLYIINQINLKNINDNIVINNLLNDFNINKDEIDILIKFNKEFKIIDTKKLNKLKKSKNKNFINIK